MLTSINRKVFGVLLLVVLGIVGYVGLKKFVFRQHGLYATTNIPSIPQANPETLPSEKAVTKQPAYLIDAYSRDGKQYIDVDFVDWLHGEAAIKAQIEDGMCSDPHECYAYPNGYLRNVNSGIRMFEVSPSASIVVSGRIASVLTHFAPTQNMSISFETFQGVVERLQTETLRQGSSFKDPKDFIVIDVQDYRVTNITEPYQE